MIPPLRLFSLVSTMLLTLGLQLALAPVTWGQSSGLLLGLKVPQDPEARPFTPARYRTLWIAPADGAVRVAAQSAGIVVPWKDGFWRVEVRTSVGKCSVTQEVEAQPATKPPRATPRRTADVDDEVVDEADECDGSEPPYAALAEELLFVGTDYLATDRYEVGRDGGPACTVRRLSHLGPWVRITELLGKPADDILYETGRRTANRLRQQPDSGLSAEPGPMTTTWAVTRGARKWELRGQAGEGCGACPDAHARFRLALAPPRSLVGHDALGPAWAAIARKVSGLRDALAPPSGNLLAVLTAKSLQVFSVRNGAIGEALLTVPLAAPDESVVMAQWATGQHVERWTRELTEILKP